MLACCETRAKSCERLLCNSCEGWEGANAKSSRLRLSKRCRRKIKSAASGAAGGITACQRKTVSEGAKAQTQRETPATSLSKYTTDLTAAAAQGRFTSLDERSRDTDRAIEILAAGQKNNPVVISDSQSVRDMVMVGVAVRIAEGNVPDVLKATRLYKVKLKALFDDSKTADQLVSIDGGRISQ